MSAAHRRPVDQRAAVDCRRLDRCAAPAGRRSRRSADPGRGRARGLRSPHAPGRRPRRCRRGGRSSAARSRLVTLTLNTKLTVRTGEGRRRRRRWRRCDRRDRHDRRRAGREVQRAGAVAVVGEGHEVRQRETRLLARREQRRSGCLPGRSRWTVTSRVCAARELDVRHRLDHRLAVQIEHPDRHVERRSVDGMPVPSPSSIAVKRDRVVAGLRVGRRPARIPRYPGRTSHPPATRPR